MLYRHGHPIGDDLRRRIAGQRVLRLDNDAERVGETPAVERGHEPAKRALEDANVSPASDLDLYVYRGDQLVGSSGSPTANEEVNLVNPTAATYTVWVHGWGVSAPSANFTLFSWVLGTADDGNMTVSAPSTAVLGGTGTITLNFSGLTPGTKYLGSVAYEGVPGGASPTIVRVDP